eukprot:3981585-Prymnesium_polylepis.1
MQDRPGAIRVRGRAKTNWFECCWKPGPRHSPNPRVPNARALLFVTWCDARFRDRRKRCGLQTMRLSNRPAGAVARSDRPRRPGGPVDHPGPLRGDWK